MGRASWTLVSLVPEPHPTTTTVKLVYDVSVLPMWPSVVTFSSLIPSSHPANPPTKIAIILGQAGQPLVVAAVVVSSLLIGGSMAVVQAVHSAWQP